MKIALLLLLVALTLPACTGQRSATPTAEAAPRSSTPAKTTPPATALMPTTPGVAPVQSRTGKVASVKPELRFIVVDFALSGVPADGTPMAVYRAGQKVAEIRITGPSVGTNTAADITAGEARAGDDVRDL